MKFYSHKYFNLSISATPDKTTGTNSQIPQKERIIIRGVPPDLDLGRRPIQGRNLGLPSPDPLQPRILHLGPYHPQPLESLADHGVLPQPLPPVPPLPAVEPPLVLEPILKVLRRPLAETPPVRSPPRASEDPDQRDVVVLGGIQVVNVLLVFGIRPHGLDIPAGIQLAVGETGVPGVNPTAQLTGEVRDAVLDVLQARLDTQGTMGRVPVQIGSQVWGEELAVDGEVEEGAVRVRVDGVGVVHAPGPEVGRGVPLLADALVYDVRDGVDDREAQGVHLADAGHCEAAVKQGEIKHAGRAVLEGERQGCLVGGVETGPFSQLASRGGHEELGRRAEEDARLVIGESQDGVWGHGLESGAEICAC